MTPEHARRGFHGRYMTKFSPAGDDERALLPFHGWQPVGHAVTPGTTARSSGPWGKRPKRDTMHETQPLVDRRTVLQTAAAIGGGVTIASTAAAGQPAASTAGVAFTQEGTLHVCSADSADIASLPPQSVDALGPGHVDFNTNSAPDIPFLSGANDVNLIDRADRAARSTPLFGATAKTSKTVLAVGSWNGSLPSVFYVAATGNGDEIVRVVPNGQLHRIATPENGVDAIAGIADIDGDGHEELVFADGSQAVRYVNQDDAYAQSFTKAYDGAGSNNNIGIGMPADVTGTGPASVPIVDGSNQLLLVGPTGVRQTLITGSDDEQAAKAPVAPADVDCDGDCELVYLENNNSPAELKYVDKIGGRTSFNYLTDSTGSRIQADTARGVVAVATSGTGRQR